MLGGLSLAVSAQDVSDPALRQQVCDRYARIHAHLSVEFSESKAGLAEILTDKSLGTEERQHNQRHFQQELERKTNEVMQEVRERALSIKAASVDQGAARVGELAPSVRADLFVQSAAAAIHAGLSQPGLPQERYERMIADACVSGTP